MKRIQLERAAERDSEQAAIWYESQRSDLGAEFILELDAAIERAAENAESYVEVYKSARRVLLLRFLYAVYFIYANLLVRIIAVIHQSREQESWQSRI